LIFLKIFKFQTFEKNHEQQQKTTHFVSLFDYTITWVCQSRNKNNHHLSPIYGVIHRKRAPLFFLQLPSLVFKIWFLEFLDILKDYIFEFLIFFCNTSRDMNFCFSNDNPPPHFFVGKLFNVWFFWRFQKFKKRRVVFELFNFDVS